MRPATIDRLQQSPLSCVTLTQQYLDRIQQLNPLLNAFITIASQSALKTAAERDTERQTERDRGRLHGIPLAVKDNIDTAALRTTIGTDLFCDRTPTADAAVVQQLQAAGAILLGKTNLNEFAADISGQNPTYGDSRNPWNTDYLTGGSSGGMAAAIAAQLCLGGLGTDTGGSIRIPASWTGLVGLRPTHGTVSLAGVFPRAPTFDTVGVMAACAADAAILWEAIAPSPQTVSSHASTNLQGLRLGILRDYTFRGVEPEIAAAMYQAIAILKRLGVEVLTLDCPYLSQQFDSQVYSTIGLYEFGQILSQIEGLTIDSLVPKVQRDFALSRQISERQYTQAQTLRQQEQQQFQTIFQSVDLWITPTTPRTAPHHTEDWRSGSRDRQFVLPVSFLGLPALSLPCGLTTTHFPIGLQLVGQAGAESLLLQVAIALEAELPAIYPKNPLAPGATHGVPHSHTPPNGDNPRE